MGAFLMVLVCHLCSASIESLAPRPRTFAGSARDDLDCGECEAIMNKRIATGVDVWFDTQTDDGCHSDPDAPWTVSLVDDDTEEVECIGSYATEAEAEERAAEERATLLGEPNVYIKD